MDAAEVRQAMVKMMSKLLPFQRKGVLFLKQKANGRGMIADEMGTGKSAQALAFALQYPESLPALIVAPASLRYNWAHEIEKWLPGLPSSGISVARGRADVDAIYNQKSSFVITTYSLFTKESRIPEAVRERGFGIVIADESHYLRSNDSQRTEFLRPVLESAERLVLLSGTPALARPVELYPQISAIDPEAFGTYDEFTKRYCNARRGPFGWDVSGSSNEKELHEKLSLRMIRRLKKDVLSQLPAKRRQFVDLASSSGENDASVKAASAKLTALGDATEALREAFECGTNAWQERSEKGAALMEAWQASGLLKVNAGTAYVADLLEGGTTKVLVFAHHKSVMDAADSAFEKLCRKLKCSRMRIDGSTPSAERARLVDNFQRDPLLRVALLSVTAAGEGLTLTAATAVVFLELHFTPAVMVQAEDRAHRIGQKDCVNVHYLVVSDESKSLDVHLWRTIAQKVKTVGATVDGEADATLDVAASSSSSSCNGGGGKFTAKATDDDFAAFVVAELPKGSESSSSKVSSAKAPPTSKADIRSFFTAGTAKKTAPPTSKTPKTTPVIDLTQDDDDDDDDVVFVGTSSSKKRKNQQSPRSSRKSSSSFISLLEEEEEEEEDDDDDDEDDEPVSSSTKKKKTKTTAEPQKKRKLYYVVSRHTGRVQVFGEEASTAPLLTAFTPKDFLGADGRLRAWPLGCEDSDVGEFLAAWQSLRAIERDGLCDDRLSLPLVPKLAEHVENFERWGEPGKCRWCQKDLPPEKAEDTTSFCSYRCACEYKLKKPSNSADVRSRLFALEHGKCVLCGLDAHSLYLDCKARSPPERYQLLLRTPGFAPSAGAGRSGVKDKRLDNPVEGMFWQADHILPVIEGGGCCSLDNYRTLCTPCHAKETDKLRKRLAQSKKKDAAKGTRDLRDFFQVLN